MKTVILNWRDGENDPFSVFNTAIEKHFKDCGKIVSTIQLTDPNWIVQLAELSVTGIDYVFTWQGLGSGVTIKKNENNESLWELLRIPLLCYHGDHPAHCPANHQLESRYCFHIYMDSEFARYSNRYLRRVRGALAINAPKLHDDSLMEWPMGDSFVMLKNISDPDETEAMWRQVFDHQRYEMYMLAVEILKHKIVTQSHVDVHGVLDDLIEELGIEHFRFEVNSASFHEFHSLLDYYVRNYRSVLAYNALKDYPLQIFGRGWGRIASRAPKNHTFQPGLKMADSQSVYYSRFGLIDISPSRILHDRTHRAMVNGCSFLSSASLEDIFPDAKQFGSLFFTFLPNNLAEKCAAVIDDPETHRDKAREFAHAYHDRFNYKNFVVTLDQLAFTVDRY